MIWSEEKLPVKVGFLDEVRVRNAYLKTQTFRHKENVTLQQRQQPNKSKIKCIDI